MKKYKRWNGKPKAEVAIALLKGVSRLNVTNTEFIRIRDLAQYLWGGL